ncbi:MAG TPA: hypothetical protein DIT99_04380, partial [Candidatus Latescibacteria bacterium]|nr:hypothetical protein [Candidatus Latescibacterota bacterium]
ADDRIFRYIINFRFRCKAAMKIKDAPPRISIGVVKDNTQRNHGHTCQYKADINKHKRNHKLKIINQQ